MPSDPPIDEIIWDSKTEDVTCWNCETFVPAGEPHHCYIEHKWDYTVISIEEAEQLDYKRFATPCLSCSGIVFVVEQEDGTLRGTCENEDCQINLIQLVGLTINDDEHYLTS